MQGTPGAGKHDAASPEVAGAMSEAASGAESGLLWRAPAGALPGEAGCVCALRWQAGHVQDFQRALLCMLSVGRGVRHLEQGG